MNKKTQQETLHNECHLLLRYACERLARSVFIRCSGSKIRILARKIEQSAMKTLLEETEQ